MTEMSILNFCQQLTALVEIDEPDLELVLDAADIIGTQLEEIRRLEGVIANLKAENATLKQFGFYE